ncbi:MAG: ABC transporter permease [Chloroflexi bacterium]|nr:ABC transporter permease [Chloroflexota bacterium]
MLYNSLVAAATISTPILLAALGGAINRQGGIVNIGLEGKMLAGAFAAVVVSWQTGSVVLAVLAAMLAGALVALPFSLLVTRLGANEIIVGFGLNIVVAGLLGYLLPVVFDVFGTLAPADLARLPRITIPVVDGIPIIGRVLSGRDPVTYLAWLTIPLTAWFLYRTRWGLRLRASGADREAAEAAGIRALRWRDASSVVAGIFAGLAGAQLAIGVVALFSTTMTGGRGFIALAAFYFGAARPWPTAAAAFLFGFFDAAQVRLQGFGVPVQLVQTLPYVVVVIVLTAVAIARHRQEMEAVPA